MTDIVDSATRSRMMAGIRSKDTKPEMALRRALHARGLRYRLHARNLPGRPDLVFPRYKAVVFVHGCFWHRHGDCRYTTIPATRPEFWLEKFSANVARHEAASAALREAGWRIGVIWECETRDPSRLALVANALHRWLASGNGGFALVS